MADGPIEEKVVCGSGLIHTFCAFRSDQEFNDDGFFTYSSTEQVFLHNFFIQSVS